MTTIQNDRIRALYRLARQEYAAAITDDQKQAIEQLKKLSVKGNHDAALALNKLKQLPDFHPLLREVLTA